MMTFKVKTGDFASILPAVNKAERILGAQVMKDTDKFLPALTGNFMQRAHLESGYTEGPPAMIKGSTIVYPGPFARFLYYGKVMVYAPTGSTWAPKNEHKVVTGRDLVMGKSMHPLASSHWFEVSKAANLDTWIKVAERLVKQNADK